MHIFYALVGTHDVESIAKKIIKGEPRRNPNVVKSIIKIKLEDALKWQHRIRQQILKEKEELYRVISRRGRLKEEFWSALRLDLGRMEGWKREKPEEGGQAGDHVQGRQAQDWHGRQHQGG